jgi:hypothetical protein
LREAAASSNKLELLQGILNYAKGNLTKVEVNEMILATDIDGIAAFHVAAMV